MAKCITRMTLIAAMLCGASAAMAQAPDLGTTQRLYEQCKDPSRSTEETYCLGYLAGVSDMLSLLAQAAQDTTVAPEARAVLKPMGFCADSFTGAQIRQVFLNWAAKNPTKWQEARNVSVMIALEEAWPCK